MEIFFEVSFNFLYVQRFFLTKCICIGTSVCVYSVLEHNLLYSLPWLYTCKASHTIQLQKVSIQTSCKFLKNFISFCIFFKKYFFFMPLYKKTTTTTTMLKVYIYLFVCLHVYTYMPHI